MAVINYDIPDNVKKIVLKEQAELKIKSNNGKFSIPQTLNSIIKEWEKLKGQVSQ